MVINYGTRFWALANNYGTLWQGVCLDYSQQLSQGASRHKEEQLSFVYIRQIEDNLALSPSLLICSCTIESILRQLNPRCAIKAAQPAAGTSSARFFIASPASAAAANQTYQTNQPNQTNPSASA